MALEHTMNQSCLLRATIITTMLCASATSNASLVTESYSFTASGFGAGAPQDPVSGSFSFSWDDAGLLDQLDLAPDMVNLTIGGKTYTTADTAVDFIRSNTGETRIIFGATITNTNNLIEHFMDDFGLSFLKESIPVADIFTYATPGTSALAASSIVVNAVPVPAAVWLFGSGLVGLVGFVRRKKSELHTI